MYPQVNFENSNFPSHVSSMCIYIFKPFGLFILDVYLKFNLFGPCNLDVHKKIYFF
ncbi:hypothetical protein Lalb_Chr19g0123921 [Lupinus albus]|uniref:Uncharacterized protein n=1 Tax=Lupinus albus TaxID=3870 RepID=A0A6A4NIH9_LUPAL|nr:hypothetical protein Lalb_Chr19g0123921 [Lupinus albus]